MDMVKPAVPGGITKADQVQHICGPHAAAVWLLIGVATPVEWST
jgi:hypothetical protein